MHSAPLLCHQWNQGVETALCSPPLSPSECPFLQMTEMGTSAIRGDASATHHANQHIDQSNAKTWMSV